MNNLHNEKSPYLAQHAKNPVDWNPWSVKATERAKRENLPLLISIGYSTCHWCHVMARESFEDNETAAIMNQHFVNIKIDREEHPDVDSLYMKAVQALTGQGGWPLTVFATPDGVPFYGGTYFPPVPANGMPSFKNILATVISAYSENKAGLERVTGQITGALDPTNSGIEVPLSDSIIEAALVGALEHHDPVNGGFGTGMKFPHTIFLKFLLKCYNTGCTGQVAHPTRGELLDLIKKSLSAMASGGLYDVIGGGFHRYTVDEKWGVPHFEKMLYDNAQLTGLYALGYEATGIKLYADAAINTTQYLKREMLSVEGGFYSAEDADSGGTEGTYYVWRPKEIRALLKAKDAEAFIDYYSITEHGNFEGANTLRATQKEPDEAIEPEIAAMHAALLAQRVKRVPPAKDKKIIVAWNALAIEALTITSVLLKRPDLLETAAKCADFLLTSLTDSTGRLRRYYLGEMSKAKAGLEDYALLGNALLALHDAKADRSGSSAKDGTENPKRWIEEANRLATEMIRLFYDEKSNRFFDSAVDSKPLFVRARDLFDNDLPSGNAAAATFLLNLSLELKKELKKVDGADVKAKEYMSRTVEILRTSTGILDYPLYHGSMLSVLDTLLKEKLVDA